MLTDLYSNLQLLLRWIHVLAGIVWIGHLYFFNFVNLQFQGTIGADIKKVVNPQLLGRAFWWFRWGAMTTFVVGLLLFTQLYMYTPGVGFGPSELFSTVDGLTGRAHTLGGGDEVQGAELIDCRWSHGSSDLDPHRHGVRDHDVGQRVVRHLAGAEQDPAGGA